MGSGVVSAGDGLVSRETRVWSSDSGAGVGGVVAGTVVVGSSRGSKTASSSSRDGTDFRITVSSGAVGPAALPELHAGTLGVAVVGTRTKGLLLLVVAHQEDLDEGAEKE